MLRPIYRVAIFALIYVPAWAQAPQFTISTIAGTGVAGYSGDGGPALNAAVNGPIGVAIDAAGNVFIPDKLNNRVRKVTPNGVITTIAGNGTAGYGGDGGPAASAVFNRPQRASIDADGNLYIPDILNHRVRRISPAGMVTTVAGNGQESTCGDGGRATNACVARPTDAVPDGKGNLFISQGTTNVIRKVDVNGIITTIAGNGVAGFSGDGGPATAASLNDPVGIALNASGDLFIADQGNYRIRKVSNGIISTVAGTGRSGFSGDGGPATSANLSLLGSPRADAAGNIYFPDNSNFRVRVLLTDGTIATVAGNGGSVDTGDGGPAISAALEPDGVGISPTGSIYVAEGLNHRIRLLTPAPQLPAITPGGVLSASSFGGFTAISPGSWIEIYGSSLAGNIRQWGPGDFNGVNAPTSLDGVSVSIAGKPAFIDYISPTQVNALIPSDAPTGQQQQLTVKNALGTATYAVTVNPAQPGILAPSSLRISGVQYAVALFSDGTYVLPEGAIPGLNSRPARPGETITFFGIGFGLVVPHSPAGQLVQQLNSLVSPLQVSIGTLAADIIYAGLAPNYTGLYQFNVTVPIVPSGNPPLTFTLGGIPGTQVLSIAVGN